MNKVFTVLLLVLVFAFAKAQSTTNSNSSDLTPVVNVPYERALEAAQEKAQEGDFNAAEASYKKALSINPGSPDAAYNLGNLHYDNNKKFEAVENYKLAAQAATSKEDKHRIFHNLGNSFLENKQYKEAVEAYKNALRNDPTDDETRYNLALAKQEEEKQGGGGGGNDDQQDQDKDKDGDQDDNKDGDQDDKSDGDNDGDQDKKEGKDGKDDGEEKEDDKGKNSEGDKGKEKDKPKDQQGKQPKRLEGKMTPQQIRQLLEAMNNEEQKIQEKIKGKKNKAKVIKSEKDW
ncbi:MAG: tetratricopeptide repeat protein [Nonlabens sp.]